MSNLLLLLSMVVFVVGLLATINGAERSSTTTHATVSPASSPQSPPAQNLTKGSAAFGFILLGFAFVTFCYWWACFFWSLTIIEDRPRVVVRAATRGVLDNAPGKAEMAFLAAKEALVTARTKLQEAADPAAEESAEAAERVRLITDAVNAAIAAVEPIQAEEGPDDIAMVDRSFNGLDRHAEIWIRRYQKVRKNPIVRFFYHIHLTNQHCFPIFIYMLKPYIAVYLTVKMFWPALRVINARTVQPWEDIWEPV